MRNLLFSLLMLCVLGGCYSDQEEKQLMSYKHELRKFNVSNQKNASNGWYFVVVGGYTGNSETTIVRLYAKDNDGSFTLIEAPLKAIKVKIEDIKTPYLTKGCASRMIDGCYSYVIHCRESDFQPEININQLR